MSKKTLAIAGIGLFGLGSALIPSAATAALSDCGPAQTGATITWNNDGCTATFSSPGNFSFTAPAEAEGLVALLVGAGSGAAAKPSDAIGYAGNGGQVQYVDFTQQASGLVMTGTVGAGGSSGVSPTSGGNTSATNGGLISGTALGGPSEGLGMQFCALNGNYSTFLGFGNGSGGPFTVAQGTEYDCGATGPGRNPSLGTQDNDSNAVPTLLAYFNAELGKGGEVFAAPATYGARAAGAGADVLADLTNNTVTGFNTSGSNGLVVFRWLPAAGGGNPSPTPTPDNELANTGSPINGPISIGSALLLIGFGLIVESIRRRIKDAR